MEVTFLGTGSMVPTIERNHSATFLSYKNHGILFDCGEGTQRQLRIAKLKSTKITKILISHWHGDHVLGLPGLLQTMATSSYTGTLELYGPKGSKAFLKKMMSSFMVEAKIKVKVNDVVKGVFFENDEFILEALPTKHSAPGLAFSFIEKDKRKINLTYLKKFGLEKNPILKKLQKGEDIVWEGKKIKADKATILIKGKKVTYIIDTKSFDDLVKLASNSDLLICEATLADEFKERAIRCFHMTSSQAASIAKKSNVKKLILTHFSQRYKSVSELKEEAKKTFKNVDTAKDFMIVKV
ncbi:MAG: ribonuclease Z [Nanoarchaeota archaeon]|nr:ribonuclease Z [Nanoarchaeota archaeon]MBU4351804.1 ribonuclease Z [Nanoarchaeota archaeon]MBU4456197.1 ribonuclease Z [Nanoarchaeota archaeon]MCG2719405.1 ribonuclease Z [Nanoarchaeota archaeon]